MKRFFSVRLVRVALGAALLGSFGAPSSGAADAKALYKEGIRAYRAGNQTEAVKLFLQSADASPSYVYPVLALGRIYQALFEQEASYYEDAVTCFNQMREILASNPPAEAEKALYQGIYFQGLLYLKGGEYDKALEALRTFLSLAPDFGSPENVYNAVGIALYYQDQYDLAVAEFRKAIEINPEYAEARFNLRSVFTRLATYNKAVANARAGNTETAMSQASDLREFAPRFLPGRRLEADLLLKSGQPDKALAAWGEILGLEPSHPITYGVRIDMAKLLESRGETGRALDLLKENLRRFPESPDQEARQKLEKMMRQLGESP